MDNQSQIAPRNTQTDMMVARQAQEVQVAMLAAKKFPRDELYAADRIKRTCQRLSLAEVAVYQYPRGGQQVSGPSIRLAEALAQGWGNIESGIIELENKDGKSEMMAYAWDLETNSRSTKIFSVEHVRDTKQGRKDLTDARDIYEATANFGARRQRACILAIIPGDIVDMAVKECKKTLASGDTRPVNEILKEMLAAFKRLGVTQQQIEKYLDKKAADLLKEDLVDLRGVYKAINDGQSKVTDYFPLAGEQASDTKKDDIVAAFGAGAEEVPFESESDAKNVKHAEKGQLGFEGDLTAVKNPPKTAQDQATAAFKEGAEAADDNDSPSRAGK